MHYHVLAGFHGCIPESNVGPFTSLVDARIELKMEVNELRDSGNTLKGNLKHCYFELIKKTTALCDYLEISKCFENSCFESDPERFETDLGIVALFLSGFHAGYEYYGIRKQKKKELRVV